MHGQAGGTSLGRGLHFACYVLPVMLSRHVLKSTLSAKNTRNRVIVVALEHLHTAFASCWDIQLHVIVEATIVLLQMDIMLA